MAPPRSQALRLPLPSRKIPFCNSSSGEAFGFVTVRLALKVGIQLSWGQDVHVEITILTTTIAIVVASVIIVIIMTVIIVIVVVVVVIVIVIVVIIVMIVIGIIAISIISYDYCCDYVL